MIIAPQRRRGGLPQAPWDLQEEVELYARESGRTAKLHFVPGGGWFARFSLRSNDKRMQLYQQGMAPEPPTEDVWFHVQNPDEGKVVNGVRQGPYLPLDILQMGRSGVREFLERGNTWSGRGEFRSHTDRFNRATEQNKEARAKLREKKRDDSRERMKEKRRTLLKIPFLPVGIDLRGSAE